MNVAEKIRETRISLKMTQSDLAKSLFPDKDPKSAQAIISRYERGRAVVPAWFYIKILDMANK